MSTWRTKFRVHPAADIFPMMSDEELAELAADIKANGLKNEIRVDRNGVLIDGRNRLEAMERAKIELRPCDKITALGDPVVEIISLNVHRRHLTKLAQAEMIVAACKVGATLRHDWRGVSGDPVKAAAVTAAKSLRNPISARTVERAFAKSEGRKPATPVARFQPKPVSSLTEARRTIKRSIAKAEGRKPAPRAARMQPKPISSLEQARRRYLLECEQVSDLAREMQTIVDALHEIADRRGGDDRNAE